MKKTTGIAFCLLCLLLCLSLSLGMAAFGPSRAGANERLSSPPKLTVRDKLNTRYLSDLAQYVTDHFFLRQELITARSRLFALFGSSAVEDVVLGKGGWLYYAPTMADYGGAGGLGEEELAAAARNLRLMQEYCESIGARFLFVPAPNKNSLYDEAMPDGRSAGQRDMERFFPLLEAEGVVFADLYEAFNAQEETLYFAHDSHWNARGAALAADVINAAYGRRSDYFSDAFPSSVPHGGDLYEMLYPAGADPETDPVPGRELNYTRQGSDTRPDSITINTSGGGSGTLLAFRDSFGNSLYPYLADSFAAARFSRMTAYDLTLAPELGADFVLVELVERNLPYLLQNVPLMPAPERPAAAVGERSGEAVLRRVESAKGPEGCILLQGVLPSGSGGQVFLSCGDKSYEAFVLAEGGFAAWLPAEETPEAVLVRNDQTTTVYAAVVADE